MKKTIITFLLAFVFPITASAQLESVKEYRRHKKCGGYKKSKMKCLQMTFEIINVVQHAFLIKKGTMKYSLVIIFATSLLASCSNNDDITVTPDHPHTYRNTGKLLSMDGGNEHLAFSYETHNIFISHWYTVYTFEFENEIVPQMRQGSKLVGYIQRRWFSKVN